MHFRAASFGFFPKISTPVENTVENRTLALVHGQKSCISGRSCSGESLQAPEFRLFDTTDTAVDRA
jgi:hypothetical protein